MAKVENDVVTRIVLTEEEVTEMHNALAQKTNDFWIRIVTTGEYMFGGTMTAYLQGPDGEESLVFEKDYDY